LEQKSQNPTCDALFFSFSACERKSVFFSASKVLLCVCVLNCCCFIAWNATYIQAYYIITHRQRPPSGQIRTIVKCSYIYTLWAKNRFQERRVIKQTRETHKLSVMQHFIATCSKSCHFSSIPVVIYDYEIQKTFLQINPLVKCAYV